MHKAKSMERPVLHILHNMVPLWISMLKLLKAAPKSSMLKLLKKAPKSLPSITHMGNPNFLLKTVQCGASLHTDSFRRPPPPCGKRARPRMELIMGCSCGARPRTTDSFRVSHRGLLPPGGGALYRGDDGTEYDTAPSTVIVESECEGSPTGFLECRSLLQDNVSEAQAEAGAAEAARMGGADVDSLPTTTIITVGGKVDDNNYHASSPHDRSVHTTSGPTPSKSTHPFQQQSEAMAKYSHDPCSDFVSSIAEMILTHGLTDTHDLQDLLHSYLHLNAPKHHPTITLAFLIAMVALKIVH